MASRKTNVSRLKAVDEHDDVRVPAAHEIRPIDMISQERWLREQFRRERSSAYWFAASKWGFLGLVLGMCFGAYMMFSASQNATNQLADAMGRAQAIGAAQQLIENNGQPARPSQPNNAN